SSTPRRRDGSTYNAITMKSLAMLLVLGVTFTSLLAADDADKPRMQRREVQWISQGGKPAYGGNCIVYQPPDYQKRTNWPVIVFYHGAGGKGKDIAALNKEYIPK